MQRVCKKLLLSGAPTEEEEGASSRAFISTTTRASYDPLSLSLSLCLSVAFLFSVSVLTLPLQSLLPSRTIPGSYTHADARGHVYIWVPMCLLSIGMSPSGSM